MGCKCCNPGEENNEMIDGNIPEKNFNNESNENENDNKFYSRNRDFEKISFNNNFEYNTDESECLTSEQKRNEEIFDYFNDLRNNPQNYLTEAEKYNLKDIIVSAKDRLVSENISNLIKNPFYNLFFDTCVRKTPYSKEDILNNIENYVQLKNYKKNLYMVEASIEIPNESIWNLLTENKDKALDDILYKKIDYFIVSSIAIPDTKKIIVYFLFIEKIKNNLINK